MTEQTEHNPLDHMSPDELAGVAVTNFLQWNDTFGTRMALSSTGDRTARDYASWRNSLWALAESAMERLTPEQRAEVDQELERQRPGFYNHG